MRASTYRQRKSVLIVYTPGNAHGPLDWAPAPGDWARGLFDDDQIERHLDALLGRQQPDGGWPLPWAAPTRAAELEWRGHETLQALRTLRAYGRIEGRVLAA